MSFSRWIIAVAFGLAIAPVGLGAQSPEQSVEDKTEAQGPENSGEQQAAPLGFPVRVLEMPEQSERAQRKQQEAEQREIEDLAAQKSMADSTEQVVFWTKLQFVLASLGTIALLYSLFLNRRATGAAIDAVRMERAWVLLSDTQFGDVINSTVHGARVKNGLIFAPNFKNVGRTPAINVFVHVEHKLFPRDGSVPIFSVPETGEARGDGGVIIAPNEGLNLRCFLKDDEASSFREQRERMAIYCHIMYRNVFDPTAHILHETEICLEAVHLGGRLNDREAIEFKPIGAQQKAT